MSQNRFVVSNIDGAFEHRHEFPRPNWDVITAWAESQVAAPDIVWTEIAAHWLDQLAITLGNGYAIWESRHFLLLCSQQKAECERLTRFCEQARRTILELLPDVAVDEGFGKIVVLFFHNAETYFDYIGDFYPEEGEFGGSGGIFLNENYSHIAVLAPKSSIPDPIVAHELTHCFLKHLDLPLWLNEGVTQVIEAKVAGGQPSLEMTRELAARHRFWWTPETIQEFWSGGSFSAPDERQELSYSLSQCLVLQMMEEFPRQFRDFLTTAAASDAGDAAIWKSCHTSLSERVSRFLGNNDWTPVMGHD